MVESNPHIYKAFLLVHSDKLNIHWNMAAGQTGDTPARPEQPYHTASIVKAFTGLLVALLVEEGKLRYDEVVAKYLPEELIKDLHLYEGQDFSKEITIGHLISNTSGLPDFYEEKPKTGRNFLDLMLDEPSRFWRADETIQWAKQNFKARFQPGKKCYYTNTVSIF